MDVTVALYISLGWVEKVKLRKDRGRKIIVRTVKDEIMKYTASFGK